MICRSQCAVQQVLHGLVYGCAHGYGSGLHLRGIVTYIHHVSQWHHRLWWMLYCNTTYTYSSVTIRYYYQYYIYYIHSALLDGSVNATVSMPPANTQISVDDSRGQHIAVLALTMSMGSFLSCVVYAMLWTFPTGWRVQY